MTKFFFSMALAASLFVPVGSVSAQGMGPGMMEKDDHTAREETEGKGVWEKFQAKQVTCASLSEDDFGVLGEYFMGAMMGNSHAVMNQMMTNAMGKDGEEQMHVAMGKRLTGCDPTAAYPAGGSGFMPMVNMWGPYGMMGGRYSSTGWWGMHGGSPYLGILGWALTVFWWVVIFVGLYALIRRLRRGGHGSALEALKERYAKGEISKQEFEEKKKDLG